MSKLAKQIQNLKLVDLRYFQSNVIYKGLIKGASGCILIGPVGTACVDRISIKQGSKTVVGFVQTLPSYSYLADSRVR